MLRPVNKSLMKQMLVSIIRCHLWFGIHKRKVYILLCLEMDTTAGQISQEWCEMLRPGEMVSHIKGL